MDYGDKPAAAKRSLLTPPRWSLFAPPLTRYVIESAFVRLGNTSIRYIHKMIDSRTGELAASSDSVEALFDFKTRKSTPLTAEMRAGIEPLVVELSDADREWFGGGR